MARDMEAQVFRWAPSTARNLLSTVGLSRRVSPVPVTRYAVLHGTVLEYYHHEDSYRMKMAPARTWTLCSRCKLSDVFPFNFGRSHSLWNPLSGTSHEMCWCVTLTFPARQADGLHVLQIGFEREDQAKFWHASLHETISRLIERDGLNSSMLRKVNREYTPGSTPRMTEDAAAGANSSRGADGDDDGDDDGSVGTWYAVKHVNGVRVFMESEDDSFTPAGGHGAHGAGASKEENARMISCVMRGDPQSVFESVWNFESYSHMKSNVSFLKVVKQVDEHRRVIHVQFPYRGSTLLKGLMPTRVVLVESTWRQDCDGTFVILFSNHHQTSQYAKTTGGLVPAKMNAAVTIAPLKPNYRLRNNYSHESLMTVVMRFEPGGWFEPGSIPRIFINSDAFFLQSMVDWFISIRERTEQERFVSKPLKIAVSSVPTESAGYKVEQVVKRVTSTAIQTLFRPGSRGNQGEGNSRSKEQAPFVEAEVGKEGMNSRFDSRFWSSASAAYLKVRGKKYLEDKVKIPAAEPMFELFRVDLFEFPAPCEHLAPSMDYVKDFPEKFFYIVQLMVPGPPHYSIIAAFTPKDKEACLEADSPFSRLMRTFVDGTDDDRNQIFKLIPAIVEGSWIVQKAVGNTPAILGKKIRIAYHRGANYIELDFDIASSAMAANIVRLVSSATKTVVVDMAFLNEGQSEDVLPEQLIGILRLNKVDLSLAKRVHMKSE